MTLRADVGRQYTRMRWSRRDLEVRAVTQHALRVLNLDPTRIMLAARSGEYG